MLLRQFKNTSVRTVLKQVLFLLLCCLCVSCLSSREQALGGLFNSSIPHLRQQGAAWQLVVDDKPYLILGGELGNSSASSLDYMQPIWPKLVRMNLNTVLAPVYWDLIEPQEGVFDFTLVDGLVRQAHEHDMRLVLLWFGSWKNSMSCYAPKWVKEDPVRFPCARTKDGRAMEILSAFHDTNRNADAKAFAALMRHLREIDSVENTVVMVQVENETGMLKDARDWSIGANKAFAEQVPAELIDYLTENEESLVPHIFNTWKNNGLKTNGTWDEVFGVGLETDEIFMAWYYACYTNYITAAGKAEYPLPMFVNAALIRPDYKPGQYPSAGPLPHLMDIWRAGAPEIDFLSPDIYFPNFVEWCQKYHISGNPLFIPEADRGDGVSVRVFYAIGQHDGMGFCPFSIESIEGFENAPLAKSYDILSQLTPLILEKQGYGVTAGVLLDKDNPSQEITLGKHVMKVSHDYTWGRSGGPGDEGSWPQAGGIIISLGNNEYVISGNGIIVTFLSTTQDSSIVGISSIQEGKYVDGKWVPGRWLNGDQSHQGRHLRIPMGRFGIQRIKLYHYQ